MFTPYPPFAARETFTQQVECHQPLLYSIARRKLQNEQDACDALQQALLKAFCAYERFQPGCAKSWLARIVVNTCVDMQRQQRVGPRWVAWEEMIVGQAIGCVPSCHPDPHWHAEQAELRYILTTAIAGLKQPYQAALLLCDLHDYSYAEAAAWLGVPVGTIKSRLSRARAMMRIRLQGHGG